MPKPAAHALTWCPETQSYSTRDPEHAGTLFATFGGTLALTPSSWEWFDWLERASSFAFIGKEGRFTARRETKQRGTTYWIAYQRAGTTLHKKYLGKTSELSAEKLEETAESITGGQQVPESPELVAAAPPASSVAPYAWELFPEQVMHIDIGQFPKGPPYDDASWILDRSHFPLISPTKERCPMHPTVRWLFRDPTGQAWCTHPTCWRRYSLMRLGALVNYQSLLGYDRDTHIAKGAEAWATYTGEKDDVRIEFSLRQAIFYCMNLDLHLPDLSEEARLHTPVYDAWK
jgi:hypothetical protein